jgi:lipoyl(octanoyl) transferase
MREVIEFVDLGLISFTEARRIQEGFINEKISVEGPERIIFCEHPATITYGRHTPTDVVELIHRNFSPARIEILPVSRGGQATWHGLGQMVIYPVVSLRRNRMGVRKFVRNYLDIIRLTLLELGVSALLSLAPAGLWVNDRKICSVGLEIRQGITNHGFSLNLSCDMNAFQRFPACGIEPGRATSIFEEIGRKVEYVDALNIMKARFSSDN